MSGMLQRGSNTFINIGALVLAGSVPQGASATLSVAHPLIKAGDVPLLLFPQLPVGNGVGAFLQEWYCTDGFLHVTFRSVQEGNYEVNMSVSVTLLRSPGFVQGPQPIGTMGVPMRLGDATNNGGPGPRYPLWVEPCTNDVEVTVAAGASAIVECSMWASGPPSSQGQSLPCQFRGPLTLNAGLAITGWHCVASVSGPGSKLTIGVVNRTGAPIVLAPGAIGEVTVLAAGQQDFSPSAPSYAAGGRIGGPVQRRHIRGATYPAANQDIVATPGLACPVGASAPDGQRVPNAVPPAGSRLWVSAPRGISGTDIGWCRLNQHNAGDGGCTHRSVVTGATTVNANTIIQDMQHVDFIV